MDVTYVCTSVVLLFLVTLSQGRDLRLAPKSQVSIKIPEGGDRILDVEFHLRPDIRYNCLPDDYANWYKRCDQEEPVPGCTVITKCPAGCVGSDGKEYLVGEESWQEGRNLCQCKQMSHVYFSLPPVPPGGLAYPPIKSCQLEGCRNYISGEVINEGEKFDADDGYVCTCMAGSDPRVMDATTLYHLRCKDSEQQAEETMEGTDDHEEPAVSETDAETDPTNEEVEVEINMAEIEESALPDAGVMGGESDVPDVVEEKSDVPDVVEEESDVPDVVEEESDVPDVVEEESGVPDVVDEGSDVLDAEIDPAIAEADLEIEAAKNEATN